MLRLFFFKSSFFSSIEENELARSSSFFYVECHWIAAKLLRINFSLGEKNCALIRVHGNSEMLFNEIGIIMNGVQGVLFRFFFLFTYSKCILESNLFVPYSKIALWSTFMNRAREGEWNKEYKSWMRQFCLVQNFRGCKEEVVLL